jgi:hypothetical protein
VDDHPAREQLPAYHGQARYLFGRCRIIDVSGEIGFVWQKSQKDIHQTKPPFAEKKYNFKLHL